MLMDYSSFLRYVELNILKEYSCILSLYSECRAFVLIQFFFLENIKTVVSNMLLCSSYSASIRFVMIIELSPRRWPDLYKFVPKIHFFWLKITNYYFIMGMWLLTTLIGYFFYQHEKQMYLNQFQNLELFSKSLGKIGCPGQCFLISFTK